jgi:hypothetical protein
MSRVGRGKSVAGGLASGEGLAGEIVNFANKDRRYYAPATEDLWFKFATGSDGGKLLQLLLNA